MRAMLMLIKMMKTKLKSKFIKNIQIKRNKFKQKTIKMMINFSSEIMDVRKKCYFLMMGGKESVETEFAIQ